LQKQYKLETDKKKSTQKVNRIFGLATVAFGPELWPMELQGVLKETHSSPLPRQNFPTLLRNTKLLFKDSFEVKVSGRPANL